jgi:hypothetical protein
MSQHEQVIEVLKENGGFATLGHLNKNVDVSSWKTTTPFASIRRIVQDKRFFFKIKPGLWALKSHKDYVLSKFNITDKKNIKTEEEFNHSYFQGLLTEIGNLKGHKTFVPNQDKNKLYLDKPLKDITTISEILEFSYPETLKRAKTIDVIWFNQRKFPSSFFEIEHSTDIQNSLLKFHDLQDFYSKFYIVGAIERKREYESKLNYSAFKDIRERVQFIDYEYVSNLHAKTFELNSLKDL